MPASFPYAIKCTHPKQSLDPALLRPSRLSHVIEVTPPQTGEERLAVLKIHTAKVHHTLGWIGCKLWRVTDAECRFMRA